MECITDRPADRTEAARIVRVLGIVDARCELRTLLGTLETVEPDAESPRWRYARRMAPALARVLLFEGAQLDAELGRLRLVLEGERRAGAPNPVTEMRLPAARLAEGLDPLTGDAAARPVVAS